MSKYDRECSFEFAVLKNKIERYFLDVTVACPYNMHHPATFYQGLFGPLSDRMMELFLAAGYRRNGNGLYSMRCTSCCACVPLRLHPQEFIPNRSQKRNWKKNSDLVIGMDPIRPTREGMKLCDRFLSSRFPAEGNSAESYYAGFFLNKITSTYEVHYRLDGKLVGNGVIDVGENWLNMVYFYFDQDEMKRGLGTYNILAMIHFCLKKNINYLYLGYAIDGLSSMAYKKHFRPYYIYHDNDWVKVE